MAGSDEFFANVSAAVFANPFSERRQQLDRAIVGVDTPALDVVLDTVRARLARTARSSSRRKRDTADHEHRGHAHLFDVYHHYQPAFARLVDAQRQAGADPVVFDEGVEIVGRLVAAGFAEHEAESHLPIFWQMHRAYRFITESLVGGGQAMRTLRESLWNNLFTTDVGLYHGWLRGRMDDFSTILLGETGTGKGAAASAIGRAGFIPWQPSKRRFAASFTAAFTEANLAGMAETLIESELFGHRKGAFTGAVVNHDGLLARCSPHGAVFLDEIGDVSIPIQIKLLHVLQTREFYPVGGHERRRFTGRVIAATNRALDQARAEGRFRDDFYYRLCADVIELPPLRQRLREAPDEFDALVATVLHRTLGQPATKLVEPIAAAIRAGVGPDYAWPGNVRELEQAVRRVLLTGSYRGDGARRERSPRERLHQAVEHGDADARTVLSAYCAMLWERYGTYEAVAAKTELDRRTVKKYVVGFEG